MTDIVEWLRSDCDWPTGTKAGMREAADEIERLRTAPWVFRCSCQIADAVAPDCASRGWCKERRVLEQKP